MDPAAEVAEVLARVWVEEVPGGLAWDQVAPVQEELGPADAGEAWEAAGVWGLGVATWAASVELLMAPTPVGNRHYLGYHQSYASI